MTGCASWLGAALGTSGRVERTFGREGVEEVVGPELLAKDEPLFCGVAGKPPGPRRGVPFIASRK